MNKHFLALGLLAALALPAAAEGTYIFGDVGQSKISIDSGDWSVSKTDTAVTLGLGYDLSAHLALELSYTDLGKVTTFQDQFEKDQLEGSATQFSVLAKLPLNDTVNLYGRLGVAQLSYDTRYQDLQSSANNESSSESKTKALVGVGASFALNEHLSLRAEYNQYAKWEEATTSTLTLGVAYAF